VQTIANDPILRTVVLGRRILFIAKYCSLADRPKNKYCAFIDEFQSRLPTEDMLDKRDFHQDLAGTVGGGWDTGV